MREYFAERYYDNYKGAGCFCKALTGCCMLWLVMVWNGSEHAGQIYNAMISDRNPVTKYICFAGVRGG